MNTHDDVRTDEALPGPPLSWPPPGLERLQGRIWRVIALAWIGSLVLILPLLWALSVEQPFYGLGPFGESWQVGLGIAAFGATVSVFAFGDLLGLLWHAAQGARVHYGTVTLLAVATDARHDMGFLIQGRRRYLGADRSRRAGILRLRLWGAALLLAAALWLMVGFGVSVLLAARGLLAPSGVALLTTGPTVLASVCGLVLLAAQALAASTAPRSDEARSGSEGVGVEAEGWARRMREEARAAALDPGPEERSGRFLIAALVSGVLGILALVPSATMVITSTAGPMLAEIAVPTTLSVQELAGQLEALRGERLEADSSISATEAGALLHDLAFVGERAVPERWERPPTTAYAAGWFSDPERFPDIFSETVARDLIARPFEAYAPEEQAALRQASEHPAQVAFGRLARAATIDVGGARWTLPLPDSLTFQDLPWPRFQAIRTAGLAHVARAAVQLAQGERAAAETTLRELLSVGFLLLDEGPTLLDNLIGAVLADMAADGLEGLHERTGEAERAAWMAAARRGSAAAAERARAGVVPADIRSLLRGIPELVENERALRGLRWEYLATFHALAPCINLHKIVFGPDGSYEAWRTRARSALVRVPGEDALFQLAERGGIAIGGDALTGTLPRLLTLLLGTPAPGSCTALVESLRNRS